MPCLPQYFLLFFIYSLSQPLYADLVFLKNGDRITGKVSSMLKNELKLTTPYSELTIPWHDIKNITSDQPVIVELEDGSQLKGLLTLSDQGSPSIQTTSLTSATPISLEKVNAINPPIISNDAIITGAAHLGGSKTSGNTTKQAFNADGKISARSGNNKYSAGATFRQSSDDGNESENNFHLFSQYDHYFLTNWYASLFSNYTKDPFQDLNSRYAFGIGIGHELWNTKKSFLSTEAGIAYTVEDFKEGTDREFIAGRWAVAYHYWILEDRLQFFHGHTGIISYEDFSDVLVKTNTGFKVPVFQGFELLVQFDLDYDTKPAEGKKTTATRYIIGAGYSW